MNAVSEEQLLWLSYRTGGDPNAHQQLFFRYLPWSRAVARDVYRRVRIPQIDWHDYVQNATIGLLEAISRYDITRGIEFIAYAKPRVRGAVFNGLRLFLEDASHRDTHAERIYERLESLSTSTSDDSLQNLVSTVNGLGLGMLLDAGDSFDFLKSDSDVYETIASNQTDVWLKKLVDSLPEREKLVLDLHYQQHLTFTAIASFLGLTKGRVSQIHKAAIERVRSIVAKQFDGGFDI